jgi:long-chain acyl-CoA synthetase
MRTVAEILPSIAERTPHQTAVVDGSRRLDYHQLNHRTRHLAAQLRKLGIETGDRVGLLLPNSLEFVTAYFGAVAAGAIVVPLNEHYQETELRYFTEQCEIKILLTAAQYRDLCDRVLAQSTQSCLAFFVEEWFNEIPAGDPEPNLWARPDLPVMYQFSSGSTGAPKRIARDHARILFELESFRTTLGIRSEDRFIGVAPFSHVNGLMRSMMSSLYAGATLFPVSRFDRHGVAELIERERISIFIAVPFMFGMLAKTRFPRQPDFSSLRLCVSASAPMPMNLNQEFERQFGRFVRQLYGSTETGTISVNLSSDVSESLESVGTPIRGVRVECFSDSGETLAPGLEGELGVCSPGAISGYEDLEEVNREVFREGIFLTGDIGRINDQGEITLLGRKKFFINKGGYKINPQEIESLLETHPGVEEVAVVGVPTAFEDEKVKAVIVRKGEVTAAELVEFCREKIADFKIPSVVEFRDALPKSSTGKIRKKLLVEQP